LRLFRPLHIAVLSASSPVPSLFLSLTRPPPTSTLFPYTTLFRSNELFRRHLAVAIEIGRARVTFRGHLRPFGRIQATILIRVVPADGALRPTQHARLEAARRAAAARTVGGGTAFRGLRFLRGVSRLRRTASATVVRGTAARRGTALRSVLDGGDTFLRGDNTVAVTIELVEIGQRPFIKTAGEFVHHDL